MKAEVIRDSRVEKSKAILRKLPLADWGQDVEEVIDYFPPMLRNTVVCVYAFKIKGLTFKGRLI